MKEDYNNGWIGFTKTDWFNMYNTNTAQYPIWISISTGLGFDAVATLKANGIDPNAVPIVFKERYVIHNILLEIEKTIPLTYVEMPN